MQLGLTLPGFVERSKTIASLPSLGLALPRGRARRPGTSCEYFEAEADGKEPADVYECDLVAISTFSAQVFEAYAIADRLRAAGVKVAMGGLHVTVLPDEAAAHADYVIIGEGENVWPAVVEAAARGDDAARLQRRGISRRSTSGASPCRATTCSATGRTTASPCRRRAAVRGGATSAPRPSCSAGRIASGRWPTSSATSRPSSAVRDHPFIEFADDNTFVDKAWGKELCRRLAPLGVKWFTETDISVADDPELLDLMREAGCRQVLIGLESPAAARWRASNPRRTSRPHGGGIPATRCGGSRRTASRSTAASSSASTATRRRSSRRCSSSRCAVPLYDVQITVLTPFPGTPLYERLVREGRILEPGRWDLCTLFDVNYEPRGMTAQQLKEGMHWLTERLYSDECTELRRRGFFTERRRARRASKHRSAVVDVIAGAAGPSRPW